MSAACVLLSLYFELFGTILSVLRLYMNMKYTRLCRYMKCMDLSAPYSLQDCKLVIDGDSYFNGTYRSSGCQFLLGSECDRYADFLINKLSCLLEKNIECYIIFKGATNYELEKRKEIHQRIIDDRNDNEQDLENTEYFQPLLIQDVQKQVLKGMGIKYFVCEYDSIEAIVGVARKFRCPVLTNKIEYCLFGVSCIPPNSVVNDKITNTLKCIIHDQKEYKTEFGVYNKMPILLTLLNESGEYTGNHTEVIENVVRLVKRQREEVIVNSALENINDQNRKAFQETYTKIKTVYCFPTCHLAVKYFQRNKPHGLFKDDKKWFAKGVSNGRIAPALINLKKKGVISGSCLLNDSNQPDALLATADIIAYSHCLLTNSQDSVITFVGREGNRCSVWEIITHREKEISNRDIFMKHKGGKKSKLIRIDSDPFENFLEEMLPGYNHNLLSRIPKDCWILIITLVYYIYKKNNNFINGAYCVLLSYLMLGPVSKNIGFLKIAGNIISESGKDYMKIYNELQFLFNKDKKQEYIRGILHSFSEFQHCLQHMNYLNKLCGEKIPCTVYHKSFNATFVYNTYLFIKDKDHLMSFLENQFQGSDILKSYKNIVTSFENSLSAVKAFAPARSAGEKLYN